MENGNDKTNYGNQGRSNSPLDRYSVSPQQEEDKSPYYKSAAPSLSLPKGGGALKGIDEKFSVNAVNGTAGLEIPLPLTPGRGGFTPALSLSYSSGGGNSEFGLGWGLSLPAIQRKTDKQLPQYKDQEESDVFLLAGAEDLVPELDENGDRVIKTSGDYTLKRYRPRIEGLFARIEHISKVGALDTWWRVTTKDNITTYYGIDADSRIANPEWPSSIFKWLPVLSIDHKGNAQQYEYLKENIENVNSSVFEKNRLNDTAQLTNTYLKKVGYGNKTPYFVGAAIFEPQMPDTDWMFEAILDYGDHEAESYEATELWSARSDAFSEYRSGFEIRTYRRCRRVMMFHKFADLNDEQPSLVRSLELTYQNDTALDPEALTETDYITKAVQRGYKWEYDADNEEWLLHSKALPPLELGYSPLAWDNTRHKVAKEDFRGAPQGLTGPYQWIDFYGEGISGIFTEQAQGWFYKNNMGDGHFSPPKTIAQKPSFTGMGGGGLQWQDLDGDGRRQVVAEAPVKGFWELGDDQKWAPFRTFENNINIDWNSPFTLQLDLDGDGLADALIADDRVWLWYPNKGKKGFDKAKSVPVFREEEKGPVLLLRDSVQSIFMADMSGDGLTDLVRIRNSEVCYWPNKGYGKFGAKVTMQNAPQFQRPDIYNPIYLTLADISGTGTADLIYTGSNKLTAWINNAGNGFGEGHDINPMPGTDPYSKIAVLDFLGNGTGCIVWSSPLPHHATAPIQYIDLMGGRKPHLLESYKNGMGKEITLAYKSSTHYYLEDKKQGIHWATKLPFPVHCVHQIITHDSVSETTYTQTYRYRHGYYDHEEREFRGFGYVETLDTDSAAINNLPLTINNSLDQPPVLTKTWYHTGAWMRLDQLLDKYKEEYFRFEGWDDFVKIANLPSGMDWKERREAYRALKGSALRQEVYALDGSEKEEIPYTVTATAYKVLKIQSMPTQTSEQKSAPAHAVFMNLQEQSVLFNCERDSEDPRIAHELVLETDEYGNVLQSAQVVYPRKTPDTGLPQKVQDEQAKMHITCTQNTFTEDAIDNIDYSHYRLPLPCEAQSFEANVASPQSDLYQVTELKSLLDAADVVDYTISPIPGKKRLLSHTTALFMNDAANAALDFGKLKSLAIPYENYTLAFTPEIISGCYGSRVNDDMLEDGGYLDLNADGKYWLPSGKAVYDNPTTKFYTPESFIDPWGEATQISFEVDSYWMLPKSTTDALGNIISVNKYDWNTLQPLIMQDANDNISEILYDALGMPVAMALKGKDDGTEGDNLTNLDPESSSDILNQTAFWNDPESAAADLLKGATWRCVYDLNTSPTAVAMIARTEHVVETGVAPVETLIRISYSDGFGRILMHKVQCEPVILSPVEGWVGSGRTIYNNKGKEVMQYEPYFSNTHHCDTAEQAENEGVSPKIHYDALGRVFKTELPDVSFTKMEWTAWQQEVWDNNDTVLDSDWYAARINGAMGTEEQNAALKAAAHADTPTVMHTDTLARGFYTLQYLSPITNVIPSLVEGYENLDIQGNRLSVVDGRNALLPSPISCLQYQYNMLQAPCYQESVDSGLQRTLLDVAGQPLYNWDALGKQTEIKYDVLRRPLKRITDGKRLEEYIYGESLATPEDNNYRGQLYQHYDGSGLQEVNGYDFKGNPLNTQLQLFDDAELIDADWDVLDETDLSVEVFTSSITYDALNRAVTTTDPSGNEQSFTYDKGGFLKTVDLNNGNYVQDIHHDAKGQREAIWYGNSTKTSYTYDPETFRLRRLLTVNLDTNDIMQDLHYWYDPVGNITEIQDDAQQALFFDNSVVAPTQKFTYDALYRLIEAIGRELIGTASFGNEDNWNDAAWMGQLQSGDGNAVQNYTQKYNYDQVGNILSLRHIADTGSYTRVYDIDTNNNQLLGTTVGTDTYNYAHDVRGNMTLMPHLDAMYWNVNNELHKIENGTMEAFYQYSGGERVRKFVDKVTLKEERIYLGNYEIYRKYNGYGVKIVERTTVHVSDDTGRIAMLETRTYGNAADDNNTDVELTRYIYSNHLQSASLELDENAAIISYEEYHPYGTTSYQAVNPDIKAVAKRYRYTGKERDEESGLYYHGARYYIPWLCRWTAVDPMESKYSPQSPLNYGNGNPIIYNDPTGMGGEAVLKDNAITININFVFYGSQTTSPDPNLKEKRQKAISDRISTIQKSLNKSGFKMEGPEGVTNNQGEILFDLKFNFQAEFVGEFDAYKKLENNIGENFDPTLTFVRLEDDFTEGMLPAQVSTTGSLYTTHKSSGNNVKSGDNSMYIQLKQFNNTSFLHELFAHILGSRDKTSHISEVEEGTTEFSVRTHKFTEEVDDKYKKDYFDPGKGETVTVLKESLRKVLQSDIDLIKPYGEWKQEAGGIWKAWLSGATNTFFKKTPELKRRFDSGGKLYQPIQFNVHDKRNTIEKIFQP